MYPVLRRDSYIVQKLSCRAGCNIFTIMFIHIHDAVVGDQENHVVLHRVTQPLDVGARGPRLCEHHTISPRSRTTDYDL